MIMMIYHDYDDVIGDYDDMFQSSMNSFKRKRGNTN